MLFLIVRTDPGEGDLYIQKIYDDNNMSICKIKTTDLVSVKFCKAFQIIEYSKKRNSFSCESDFWHMFYMHELYQHFELNKDVGKFVFSKLVMSTGKNSHY